MRTVSERPSSSSRAYPKTRSTAGLANVMVLASSMMTIASVALSASASKLAATVGVVRIHAVKRNSHSACYKACDLRGRHSDAQFDHGT
jgi:hypothetical protein